MVQPALADDKTGREAVGGGGDDDDDDDAGCQRCSERAWSVVEGEIWRGAGCGVQAEKRA